MNKDLFPERWKLNCPPAFGGRSFGAPWAYIHMEFIWLRIHQEGAETFDVYDVEKLIVIMKNESRLPCSVIPLNLAAHFCKIGFELGWVQYADGLTRLKLLMGNL